MSLKKTVETAYIEAFKGKDAFKTGVLRMVKSAFSYKEKALMRELTDDDVLDSLAKEVKTREDAARQFTDAKRPDLAEKEAAEAAYIKTFLPAQIGEAELDQAIDEAIKATGAASAKDMGKVMGKILAAYKGRVDGGLVSAKVKARLSA